MSLIPIRVNFTKNNKNFEFRLSRIRENIAINFYSSEPSTVENTKNLFRTLIEGQQHNGQYEVPLMVTGKQFTNLIGIDGFSGGQIDEEPIPKYTNFHKKLVASYDALKLSIQRIVEQEKTERINLTNSLKRFY